MSFINIALQNHLDVVISLLFSVIGIVLAGMISFSFWITWKRSGYKMVGALSIFFAVLAMNRTIAAVTSFVYLVNDSRLLVIQGYQWREAAFTAALAFVFYTLWFRNNKVRKAMEVQESLDH